MAKLVWNEVGKKLYETGVFEGALYPQSKDGKYPAGVAWEGLISVSDSPSGAEPTKLYANNALYLSLYSAEEWGGTIEAYTYPDEFAACDGSAEAAKGVTVGQQKRVPFGFVYKTIVGNDVSKDTYGYKLHIVYGAVASPSEKGYSTINDSPEAITLSWEVTATPVAIKGFDPSATLVIDSTKVDKTKLAALEAVLYGSEDAEAKLPMPDEIIAMLADDSEG